MRLVTVLLACGVLASNAFAGVISYESEGDFVAAIGTEYMFDPIDLADGEVQTPTWDTPAEFGYGGQFSVEGGGLLFSGPGFMATNAGDATMRLDFTGQADVYSVGGNFFGFGTLFFIPMLPSQMDIEFSDGTMVSYFQTGEDTDPPDFRGFISDVPLEWITIFSHRSPPPHEEWYILPSVDNLYIGGIPEPTTLSLFAIGGLALLRRRR